MRQLGMPFAEEFQVFGEGSNWAAFRRFSPSGTVPCLVDGDVVVWDSLAIVEYLAERHPGVWPADPLARAWARSAAAEMHAGFAALRSICPMNCGIRIRLHAVPEALSTDLERIDELWREGLRRFGGPCLAGSAFSAVDAFFAPVAFRIQSYGLPVSEPCLALAARLLALPGMVEWYTAALAEPWREVAHEAEALAVGTLLADFRAPSASPP